VRADGAAQLMAHNLHTRAGRLLHTFDLSERFFASTLIDVAPDASSVLVSPVARDESDLVVVEGFR
jgi:hypothetical protein